MLARFSPVCAKSQNLYVKAEIEFKNLALSTIAQSLRGPREGFVQARRCLVSLVLAEGPPGHYLALLSGIFVNKSGGPAKP